MNPPALLQKRLLIVAGKGGVGKSTVAAALALNASRQGKRVLVAEIHGAERMSYFFEVAPVGPNIREIRPNLFAVNVQPRDAMREYALMVLRLKALYNLVFENKLVRYFLDAFPGLNELVMLGKIWYHVEETDKKTGRPRWDLVVVDAPATGHGVFFLEFPQVVLAAIQGGPLAFHAARMREMLTDPRRTSLQIVTLPEEMPVREALDLRRVLQDELKIPLGYVFVNCVHPPLFNQREFEDYRLLLELADAKLPRLRRLCEAAQWRISRWRNEDEHLALIRRSLNLPRVELPFVYEREFRAKAIEFLARKMGDQLGQVG
jgi:anion-transporting  ArsA/GET3 family ATPase